MSGAAGRRRALVTGAGRRVGRAIALKLGQAGMKVAVHYHQSSAGAETTCRLIREAGGEAFSLSADLSQRDAARSLVDSALAELGGLDLLVASAANFERIPYDSVDDAAWDRALGLNLSSPFTLAHAASPALRQSRGSIVFITCASATTPFKNHLPYVVSKGALRHLMKILSLELAPEVRVNAVAPGTVDPAPDLDQKAVERIERMLPLQRLGSPEDVARAVLFLADSPFVTGQEIRVDGGRSVARVERFG